MTLTVKNEINIQKGRKVEIEKENFSLKAYISPFNKRVRLLQYSGPGVAKVAEKLGDIASDHEFATKVFAKIRRRDLETFKNQGFTKEAVIKGYFNGNDAVVVANYLDEARRETPPEIRAKEREIEESLNNFEIFKHDFRSLPNNYRMSVPCTREDFEQLAALYRRVFETYPFPILDAGYLERTAATHMIYAVIYDENGMLISAASAEMDPEHKNSEMTDFATLPSHRGKGLASILLNFLEKEVKKKGITNVYTIARSRSFGMNRVFKKAGYDRTGKLINNCCICGNFENMTVWCKSL